jgi:hypothetical protein
VSHFEIGGGKRISQHLSDVPRRKTGSPLYESCFKRESKTLAIIPITVYKIHDYRRDV